MAKKCVVCNKNEAEYRIKNAPDYYCSGCAQENFSDLSFLVHIEEGAQKLKHLLDTRMGNAPND